LRRRGTLNSVGNSDDEHPRLEIVSLPFRATHFPVSASTARLLHLKDKEG